MPSSRSIFAIIGSVAAMALVGALIALVQRSDPLWLLAVAVMAPWIFWHFAKQLYTASMQGYVLTGVPERRVYREDNPRLFRNNVIGYIILFPIAAAGAVIVLLDALEAQNFIR